MPDKKLNINIKNLNVLSERICNQLIREFKFDTINMLAGVAAGKVKKLIIRRPLSKNGVVNDCIDMYLDYYNVGITKKY